MMPRDPEKRREYRRRYYEANKERLSAQNKAWYEANKEHVQETQRRYREEHREERKLKDKAYHEAHKEQRRVQSQARYAASREETIARVKAWQQANPDKKRLNAARSYERNKEKRRAHAKEYREANKEMLAAKASARNRQLRLDVLGHYSNGTMQCACCGLTDYEFLTLDHINGGGNKHRQSVGGRGQGVYRQLRDQGYPEGYRVLCMNCNHAFGHFGYCPHHPPEDN